jgi:hypothetical protein
VITFLFLLIILGCALYLVENYVPMAAPFKIVIRVVVILWLLWYLLGLFGLAPTPLR